MNGVFRTRVGYTGGTTPSPTYRSIGDHTETLQVDFDPIVISYEDLLEIFWASHSPVRSAWATQYKAAIFVGSDAQRERAVASAERQKQKLGKKITTEILPLERFYIAEDYHQKYYLQMHRELNAAMTSIYPQIADFTKSTAVAKINGLMAGHGREQLEFILPLLGLDDDLQRKLAALVRLSA